MHLTDSDFIYQGIACSGKEGQKGKLDGAVPDHCAKRLEQLRENQVFHVDGINPNGDYQNAGYTEHADVFTKDCYGKYENYCRRRSHDRIDQRQVSLLYYF